MTNFRWTLFIVFKVTVMLAILAALFLAVPQFKGATDWTGQLIKGGWMAWTFPVAMFFWVIAALLLTFSYLAIRHPETPKRGILGIETTRGDRLFISLVGSGFINLAWIGLTDLPQWGALFVCLAYATVVFRKV